MTKQILYVHDLYVNRLRIESILYDIDDMIIFVINMGMTWT